MDVDPAMGVDANGCENGGSSKESGLGNIHLSLQSEPNPAAI